jgi:hypothetical protein
LLALLLAALLAGVALFRSGRSAGREGKANSWKGELVLNKYEQGRPPGAKWPVLTKKDELGNMNLFHEVSHPEQAPNVVALFTSFGKYLTAQENGTLTAESFKPGNSQYFTKFEYSNGKVALQSAYGKFMWASPDGTLEARSHRIGSWEMFEKVANKDGNVALKDAWGRYISVGLPEDTRALITNRATSIGDMERFTTVNLSSTEIALRSFFGTYINASVEGLVLANANNATAREAFQISGEGDRTTFRTPSGSHLYAGVDGSVWIGDVETSSKLKEAVANGVTSKDFRVEAHLDGTLSLRSTSGTYLSVVLAIRSISSSQVQEAAGLGDGSSDSFIRYKFISTTVAPRQTDPDKVSCMAGQPWPYKGLILKHMPVFEALPSPDHWEDRWSRITAANSDPCASRIRLSMNLASKDHGFGSAMNNFANEAFVGMYSGEPVAICRPPGVRDIWAENYVDPGLPVCDSCTASELSEPAVWCSGAKASMQMASSLPVILEGVKRFMYWKLFNLNPAISEAASKMQGKLGILHEPYVGVHIRRGDKLRESGFFRQTKDFAAIAEQLCDAMGARKIFVASDDPKALTEMRTLVRSDLFVQGQPPLTELEYAQRGENLEKHTETVLLFDVVLLIRANAYVGTASSNVDRFVYFQRDPRTQSVSLDDGGDYLYRSC